MPKIKSEFDTPWKMILGVYFQDFMAYCWPEKYVEIDWSKGYRTLDKELNKVARNAPIGNRVADKLIEVYLEDGQTLCILIHLEIQGYFELHFGERMFVYRYRLRDLYGKPIVSLAILIDGDRQWRPNCFREELWGSSVEMRFPIIKILDYRARIPELETSTNPFAQVILAQLTALERQLPEAKLMSKVTLIKRLYSRGWGKDDIINLLVFIDWVMALPPTLELEFQEAVKVIEEESRVRYVTSFERVGKRIGERIGLEKGIQRGVQQGIQQGEGRILIRLLERKFKTLPEHYKQKIEKASSDNLLEWSERVLDCQELEDVFEV